MNCRPVSVDTHRCSRQCSRLVGVSTRNGVMAVCVICAKFNVGHIFHDMGSSEPFCMPDSTPNPQTERIR